MSNEETDKDVDVEPVLLPETSDEEKNTEDVMSKDQPSSSRDAELLFMTQKIKALEEERDFLRQTVKTLSDKRVSREEVCLEDIGSESADSDDTPPSSSTSSSSDDGHPRKRKHGKKKKEKLVFREKRLQVQSGTRARTPEDVLKRYKMTLKAFKKEGSMNRAFKKVGVDRNTLALTAVVAELQMVDPDFFKSIPKFSPSEKLIDFS
ncbi:coiled-coil domain-containing protein 106-like [Colossoma macropomum]|uniref:coiled-coil domain-containing protein 106-like n=1 Tax=Colossoma macropomum TaxID=42526 RepID=UPI001864D8D6|nr:coiled-coil domain-containing protein 106-like [Colossoma macropomum]